jgi:putative ABC transport system permease protein
MTIWIDLSQAQHLLGAVGRINSIVALKCQCEGSDIASIRRDIGRLLPGVQVIELASKAMTRTEARDRAAAAAKTAIEADRAHRARMRRERESFAAWLLPLVMLGAAVWIGLLAFMNVRERTPEIGILRALGLRSRQIITIFVARAALAGLVGAVLGYGVGFAVGVLSGESAPGGHWAAALFKPGLLGLVALTAPILASLASLSPALIAARHDPAAILRNG